MINHPLYEETNTQISSKSFKETKQAWHKRSMAKAKKKRENIAANGGNLPPKDAYRVERNEGYAEVQSYEGS